MTQDTIRARVIGELGPMRRYALALTRDAAAADDLVQDALLRAFERRASFRPDGPLRSWLLSILHNCFIDGRRRDDARGRRDAAFVSDEHSAPAQEHAVRLGQVAEAFLGLPAEQRAALHLVAVEGMSYAEAAAVLDIPAGTVMSRISRARAALRAMEEGQGRPPGLRLVGGADDNAD
ncbi:sigma-70 family RNA polymerase sigma factor [Zavarzinia aquatilis]|uniref:RNA polymerase sigma factor n=1 Tax=Zavarzinia aquatilis TaxID=2211142 RepID=A0A317EED1_9PROT|nr:sigma-70 family RNA polymerase sigma factor [Zavarzinia aquatilis]PWR25408.1 RNA polymerase subunit sigma [Zavarzinia aquatilis]